MIKNRNCDFTPAIELPVGTADPAASANLQAGMMYYKAGSTKKIRFWNGSAWANIEGAGGGASAWVDLSDTPGAITAKSLVRSNAAGDALECAPVTSGKIIVGNASDIPTAVTPSGDVAISAAGLFTVTDLTITNEAAGDILYFDGTNWIRLAKDSGKYLKSGASAVSWENVSVAVADKLSDTFDIEGGTNDITVDITTQTVSAPTVTLPDLGGAAQEWVFTKVAQTLEGKTLTTPIIVTTGYIADASGAAYLKFIEDTTPVNFAQITNSDTGVGVEFASEGTDTDIDLLLVAKGTGKVKADGVEVVTLSGAQTLTAKTLTTPKFVNTGYIADSAGNELIMFGVTGSATTYLKVTNAINAGGVTLEVAGGGTNENLLLVAKGSGVVKADGVEVVTLSDTQTLTNKTLTSPNVNEAVALTATATELNTLDGVNVGLTAAELNLLDGAVGGTAVADKALVLGSSKNVNTLVIADSGLKLGAGAGTAVTATAAELNKLDGVTAGTASASLALVLGANKDINELHIPDGGLYLGAVAGTAVTSTAVELNYLDTSSPGVAVASKALVLGTNKNVDELHIAEGKLYLGAAVGTAVSSTAAELNYLDTSSPGVAVASKALVLGTNKNVDELHIADSKLYLGTGAGTAVTSTAVELNKLDGVTAGTVSASLAIVVDSNKRIDHLVIADGGLYLGSAAGTQVTSTAAELNKVDGVTGTLIQFQEAAIAHDDAAAALMTLPANAKIHFIEFIVTTAWVGGSTSYDLGLGADPDALTDGTVLSAIGKASGVPPTGTIAKWDDTGADTAVTGTDVDSNAGAGKVRVYYSV